MSACESARRRGEPDADRCGRAYRWPSRVKACGGLRALWPCIRGSTRSERRALVDTIQLSDARVHACSRAVRDRSRDYGRSARAEVCGGLRREACKAHVGMRASTCVAVMIAVGFVSGSALAEGEPSGPSRESPNDVAP